MGHFKLVCAQIKNILFRLTRRDQYQVVNSRFLFHCKSTDKVLKFVLVFLRISFRDFVSLTFDDNNLMRRSFCNEIFFFFKTVSLLSQMMFTLIRSEVIRSFSSALNKLAQMIHSILLERSQVLVSAILRNSLLISNKRFLTLF